MTVPFKLDPTAAKWIVHRVLDAEQPWHVGVTTLMAEGLLKARDVAVYLAIMERVDWRTGRCCYTTAAIARAIGMTPNYATHSISRLKKQMVLLNQYCKRTGERWFLLNPSTCWCGNPQRQAILAREWELAWRLEHAGTTAEPPQDKADHELQPSAA